MEETKESRRHKWKMVGKPQDNWKICVNCGVEKFKMRYGWKYHYKENIFPVETYTKPPCKLN